MSQALFKTVEQRMQKCIEAFKTELSRLRTGRAHPSLIEHLKVECYGTETPLLQAASITVEGARTLVITPWDKGMVGSIEKAIQTSDLGLNPVTAGLVIRVPLPALTEERRRSLTRVVKDESEKAKVAIRNVRRDALNEIKQLLKQKEISEDDQHRAETRVQQLTDQYIKETDEITQQKEQELMTV